MVHIHDDATVICASDLSHGVPHAPEYQGSEPDGAVRPDSLDQAGQHLSDFGHPIEDWMVD
jgi:hypothetical protein